MKNKKTVIIVGGIILIVLLVTLFYFFYKNNYKIVEFGNNSNKSSNNLEEYILNMSSYEAKISMEIHSNKNINKYEMVQKFSSPNIFKQEMSQPNNIKGLTITYDGTNLQLNNTGIGLTEVYENYQYISSNSLCLYNFIEDYKKDNNAKAIQKEDEVIMETKVEKSNSYMIYKKLYIDKKTKKPSKLTIEDRNQKILVYILYNEINLNSISKDEVLAFRLNQDTNDI